MFLFLWGFVNLRISLRPATVPFVTYGIELRCMFGKSLKVDGAWGGAAALVEAIPGLTDADTITVDAHKQLQCPIGTGALLLKDPLDPNRLAKAAEYIIREDSWDQGRFTLEGSRPAMALYVHLNFCCQGREGMAAPVRRGRAVLCKETAATGDQAQRERKHREPAAVHQENLLLLYGHCVLIVVSRRRADGDAPRVARRECRAEVPCRGVMPWKTYPTVHLSGVPRHSGLDAYFPHLDLPLGHRSRVF